MPFCWDFCPNLQVASDFTQGVRGANPKNGGNQPIIWPKFAKKYTKMKKMGRGGRPKFYYVYPPLPTNSSVCMKGYYKNDTACAACAVRTYKDTIGDDTTCTTCPDQKVTDASGADNVNLCGKELKVMIPLARYLRHTFQEK